MPGMIAVLLSLGVMAQAGAAARSIDEPPPPSWKALRVRKTSVSTGTKALLRLHTSDSFAGRRLEVPLLVARGARPGPTTCLTAGIHGDELNGIEVVRRVFERTDPKDLYGTLVGLPVVNMHGFRRSSRYLPDRRDLNRFFPGRRHGSAASRIAHRVFGFLSEYCESLVDLHTGSGRRINFPQARADLTNRDNRRLALLLKAPLVIQSRGSNGMLRKAMTDRGIPAVTYEAGEAHRFQLGEIEGVVVGIRNLLAKWPQVRTSTSATVDASQSEVLHRSRWIRSDQGGIFTSRVSLGERVKAGQMLGQVQAPFSGKLQKIAATRDAMVIGLAQPQMVLPGFATVHIGYWQGDDSEPEEAGDGE